MPSRLIYLDNASTSHPKPDVLWQSTRDYLTGIGVSPNRGSYGQSRKANRIVEDARTSLARLINAPDPKRIAFTANATHALNTAIQGVLSVGDHVVTTNIEHNSVLRPLETASRGGRGTYEVVSCGPEGTFDLDAFRDALRRGCRLLIASHASNVTGVVTPVAELAELAHEHDALFLLDASQSAGLLDIDVEALQVDLVAFTGHKGLYGPSGTGALFVRDPSVVRPLYVGGSGVNSQSLRHPATMPEKFEAGTVNYLGIHGLGSVVGMLGPDVLRARRGRLTVLTDYCLNRLRAIDGITLYHAEPGIQRVPVISLNVDGFYPSEVCAILDDEFSIMTRAGLHCAPLIHESLGTMPQGTLRVSLGAGSTRQDVDALTEALTSIRDRSVAAFA